MENIIIPYQNVQIFFLIILRVSAILLSLPMFDSTSVPAIFKIGIAFAISCAIFPVVSPFIGNNEISIYRFFFGAIKEIILGLMIGFSIKLVFAGIQLGGQTAGNQMGFGLSRVIDPVSGYESNAISQFYNITAILIFFTINAHHIFIRALVESFKLVPLMNFTFNDTVYYQLIKMAGGMFIIAAKIGGPLIVALLITSVALGLVARTVPQMNIFIVALPVKILGGLLFLIFCIPFIRQFVFISFDELSYGIYNILNSIK